jgi:hypothetical protein
MLQVFLGFALPNMYLFATELSSRRRFVARLGRSGGVIGHEGPSVTAADALCSNIWESVAMAAVRAAPLIVYGTLAGYVEDSPLSIMRIAA